MKPMPTVAEKVPVLNLPVSNCTSREVLPTPLSPSKMVCNMGNPIMAEKKANKSDLHVACSMYMYSLGTIRGPFLDDSTP